MEDENVEKTGFKEPPRSKIHGMVYRVSFLTFLAILAPAVLHSNDSEFFSFLFGGGAMLPEPVVLEYSSLYDSVYYIAFIAGLVISPLADNCGRRKIFIVVGSVMFAISSFFILVSPSFHIMLVFRLLQGIFHTFAWQTLMVLVYDNSNETNKAKSVSIHVIAIGAAMGTGTMFGGVLAELGPQVPTWFAIGLYSLVFVLSIVLITDPTCVEHRPTVKDGFLLFKKHPSIMIPSLFNFIDRLHMGFLVSIVPLYLTYIIPLSPGLRGMIFGISALPSLFMSYPVGKRSDGRWGRFKPLVGGSIAYGILLASTGFLAGDILPAFIILLMSLGVAQGFTTTPTSSLLGDMISPGNHAAAVGFFNFFGNVGMILGPLLGLAFGVHYTLAFLVAGLIELGSLAISVFAAKRLEVLDF